MPNKDELPVNHDELTRMKREFYDAIRARRRDPLEEILAPFLQIPVVHPGGRRTMESVAAIQNKPSEAPAKPADLSIVTR